LVDTYGSVSFDMKHTEEIVGAMSVPDLIQMRSKLAVLWHNITFIIHDLSSFSGSLESSEHGDLNERYPNLQAQIVELGEFWHAIIDRTFVSATVAPSAAIDDAFHRSYDHHERYARDVDDDDELDDDDDDTVDSDDDDIVKHHVNAEKKVLEYIDLFYYMWLNLVSLQPGSTFQSYDFSVTHAKSEVHIMSARELNILLTDFHAIWNETVDLVPQLEAFGQTSADVGNMNVRSLGHDDSHIAADVSDGPAASSSHVRRFSWLQHLLNLGDNGHNLGDHGHNLGDHGHDLGDHGHDLGDHGHDLSDHLQPWLNGLNHLNGNANGNNPGDKQQLEVLIRHLGIDWRKSNGGGSDDDDARDRADSQDDDDSPLGRQLQVKGAGLVTTDHDTANTGGEEEADEAALTADQKEMLAQMSVEDQHFLLRVLGGILYNLQDGNQDNAGQAAPGIADICCVVG